MAKLSAHGQEIGRYFDRSGQLVAFMGDGVTLVRSVWSGWKVYRRKKPDVPIEEWHRRKRAFLATLPEWQRDTKSLPSRNTLEAWSRDGICETPTGHRVEPDGTGPDGVPSWLRLLRMI